MTATALQTKIEIAYPDTAKVSLLLRLGPCHMHFTPSDGPMWITGTYEDPTGALPIEVRAGETTYIAQRFDLPAWSRAELPHLELAIGRTRPFQLEINAGASETAFDLGGLPLERLAIKAGAGRFDVDFSRPNPVAMSFMELATGAGAFTAKHLTNAAFTTLQMSGGIAACALDFSGELRSDANARIDSGLGSIDIAVPSTTAAAVRTKAFAAAKRTTGFIEKGDTSYTLPALEGKRPLLTIDVSMAFGSLAVTTS
ncbi:MAG TPA: hypothetical protein VI056_15405 [Candidatus Limnocylindria bacterium]